MIAFVREHADRFGVEAICRTLSATVGGFITARGYRAAVARPRSARSISDEVLRAQIVRLHEDTYSVYPRPPLGTKPRAVQSCRQTRPHRPHR
jgi:putative transposase